MSVKLNQLFSETPLLDIKELTYIENYKNNIDEWSATLIHLELGEAAKQIFTTLLELRSLNCDDFLRFSLLEKIQNSLTHLLSSLEQHYLSNSLLDTKRDQQIADLVLEIKAHHALIYIDIFKRAHQVLVTNKFSLFEFNQKKKLTQLRKQCAFLGFKNLNKLLYSLQLLYLDVPKFFWSTAYSAFHIAKDYGFEAERINETTPETDEDDVTTVEGSFIQLILSSLLNSHKLRQTEIRDLIHFVTYWTELVRISKEPDQHTQYAFNHLHDNSPKFYVKSEYFDKDSYYINVSHLVAYIDAVLQPSARYYSKYEEKNFSNVLKHHVQSALNPDNIRHSPRFSDDGVMELSLGITSAHFFLSYAQHFKETLQLDEPYTSPQPALSKLLADKEIQLSSKTHEQRFNAEVTKIYNSGIVNRSETGYCLQWLETTPRHLRAGEFILLRDNSDSPWQGSIIRWLKTNNQQQIEFGVELFSTEMCPIAICIPKPGNVPIYHPAILFFEENDLFSIIVPSSQIFHENQNLIFRLGQAEIKVFLTNSTLLTQSCAKFSFDLLEQSKYPILKQYFEEHLHKLNTQDLWDSLK